jgi:signal transduction histidine kinase/DNA-binding response OmpR family regulator
MFFSIIINVLFLSIIIALFQIITRRTKGRSGYDSTGAAKKQLESFRKDMMLAKNKAEKADAAKGLFLANMSHEIRTPLNGIVGLTELLLETPLDGNQIELMSAIDKEVHALLFLVNDILDYSKINAGEMKLELTSFNIISLINDLIIPFKINAAKKGVNLHSQIDKKTPEFIIGDPGRLRQVITNLVSNAVKFTEKGEVVVSIEASSAETADEISLFFSVKDTGIGVDESMQDLIFNSFVQADESTTRKYGGTGLGTTISKQLVELMGGKINITSKLNQGTDVSFSATFKTDRNEKSHSIPRTDLSGTTILIVDSSSSSRTVLKNYFESLGCTSYTCGTASEGLALSETQTVDVGIIDTQLPDMEGFDLAKRFQHTTPQLPLILLSSSGSRGDSEKCINSGVRGYLPKPADIYCLRIAVEILLGTQPTSSLITRHFIKEKFDSRLAMLKPDIPCSDVTDSEPSILIVEDTHINQKVLLKMIQLEGYNGDIAVNGKDGVEQFKKGKYSLVLMDMQMPVMDGYDAVKKIREFEARKKLDRTPVIAITAHAMKEDKKKCEDAGADDYYAKPINRKTLNIIFRKWLPRKKQGAQPVNYQKMLREFSGDIDFLYEVIEAFIKKIRTEIPVIKDALAKYDYILVSNTMHSVKGGALNLTAEKLASAAKHLEEFASTATSGTNDEGQQRFTTFINEFKLLEDWFLSLSK